MWWPEYKPSRATAELCSDLGWCFDKGMTPREILIWIELRGE